MIKGVKSKNCDILMINVTYTKNFTIYELTNFYWFHLNSSLILIFYLPLTTCHLDFVVRFFWKCCVTNTTRKIFNFIKKKKKCFNLLHLSWKKINHLFRTLAYFAIDNEMELFFPAFFFFINKKLHHRYNQQIYIYIWDSFFSFSLLYVSLIFLCLIKWFAKCSMDFQVQEFF